MSGFDKLSADNRVRVSQVSLYRSRVLNRASPLDVDVGLSPDLLPALHGRTVPALQLRGAAGGVQALVLPLYRLHPRLQHLYTPLKLLQYKHNMCNYQPAGVGEGAHVVSLEIHGF